MARFAGDKKYGKSILSKPEDWLRALAVPLVPRWLETQHLTMMTLLWSFVVIIAGHAAQTNRAWLWIVTVMIIFQYITDLLDGSVGRYRNTGLIKWGYYMDHLLDYVFVASLIFVGYLLAPAHLAIWFFAFLALIGGYMVNSFLAFAATNRFEVYHYGFGPTESRILFIIANTALIYFGTHYLEYVLPATTVILFIGLLLYCRKISKELWRQDMEKKSSGN